MSGPEESRRDGGREGGENLCLCGQTTQKLERHRLIKMHSVLHPAAPHPLTTSTTLTSTPLCCFPSSSLSHFTSPPSLHSLPLMQAVEGHSSLMFWVVVCGCKRSRQPYFLNGGVTGVNKAGWPSTSLHLSLW